MTAQMVVGAILGLPALLWTGLPAAAALPWLAGSTCINLVIVTALLRAYGLLGFGTPIPWCGRSRSCWSRRRPPCSRASC